MLKHVTFLGAAAVVASLSSMATAQDVTAATVVATVGDTEITLGEVLIARTALPQQYSQFPNDVLFSGLIDQLVQQQLLADQFGTATPAMEYTLLNDRRAMMANALVSELAEAAATEDAITAAYEARFADAVDIPEFRASHLLVETEEEAAAAKARIDGGIAFADVAREVSTGPTGPNGGDLGWFGAGAMVPEFENQINLLEIGGVSDPFETQFGWHVATLVESRTQPRPSIEELHPQLINEIQEAAVSARIEELSADTIIVSPEEGQFDPDLLNNFELLE
jgi:peptidyl-prolyl cis-trans isomerase C